MVFSQSADEKVVSAPHRPDEFELIARHFAKLSAGFPGAYGLLDDAAVISPRAGHELVVKTDSIVGGVDFLPDTPANLIARKALRVNLSDLAAKGAVPLAYLVDLIVPTTIGEEWIAAFAAGLAADQAEYSMHLIGGTRARLRDRSVSQSPCSVRRRSGGSSGAAVLGRATGSSSLAR